MITRSILTCPFCAFSKEEEMPLCGAETTYVCAGCGRALEASGDDCCIHCKYGSMHCPPRQSLRDGCCAG